MDKINQKEIIKQSFDKLENRLGELLALCRTLKHENSSLRRQNEKLLEERSSYNMTKSQVRSQVEGLVNQLKSMENA